jgi:Polyketide cyclase / dehydrase and lipid transport
MGLCQKSIYIKASATVVDRCLTELELIHRWRNGLVTCEALGEWLLSPGSRSRLRLENSLWPIVLRNNLVRREPGLVRWEFQGLLRGFDQWECQPAAAGTQLVNRWQWQAANGWLDWWWRNFGARAIEDDIEAQLMRIKYVAEEIYYRSGFH